MALASVSALATNLVHVFGVEKLKIFFSLLNCGINKAIFRVVKSIYKKLLAESKNRKLARDIK